MRRNKKKDEDGAAGHQEIQEEDIEGAHGTRGRPDDDGEMDVDFDPSAEDDTRKTKARDQAYDKKDKPLSNYEMEKAELETAPVIPRSEMSPAAFIFAQTEEEQ